MPESLLIAVGYDETNEEAVARDAVNHRMPCPQHWAHVLAYRRELGRQWDKMLDDLYLERWNQRHEF